LTFDFECVMIVHDYKNVMGLSVPLVLASHGDTQERCNMNTKFNITLTKGDKQKYTVDLGVDILEWKSDAIIREYAVGAAVVALQNDSKLALRFAGNGDELRAAIYTKYPYVTVTPYVKPEPKVKVIMTPEEMLAKALGIDVANITPEFMAQAKALAVVG